MTSSDINLPKVKYQGLFGDSVIRRASKADLEQLLLIERLCFLERRFQPDHILWILENPKAATFVYDEDGVLGSVMVITEGGATRVLSIGVHPGFRRRGVGTALMKVAEDHAQHKDSRLIRLEVSTKNEQAVSFYRALGYREDGYLRNYYSWGDDAYSMIKALDTKS